MKAVALKLVLRSWWRNKTFSIISIVSLAIGIACTNLLAAFVIYEFNIEASNPDKDKIVYMAQDSPMTSGEEVSYTVGSIAPQLKEQYTEVENYLRFTTLLCKSVTIGNKQYAPLLILTADTTFTDFFSYTVLHGDLRTALSAPDKAAISESCARKLFGKTNVTGQIITANLSWGTPATRSFQIAAVIKEYPQSFLTFDMLTVNEPDFDGGPTLLKVTSSFDKKSFPDKLKKDKVPTLQMEKGSYHFYSLQESYFRNYPQETIPFINRGKQMLLYVGQISALLILLIACFNYINLSFSRVLQQIRMVHTQKLMGAGRRDINLQLFTDTSLTVLASFLLSLLLSHDLMPVFNHIMSSRLSSGFFLNGQVLPVIIGLILLLSTIPALYMSRKITRMTDSSYRLFFTGNKKRRIVTLLSIVQFTISISLIIATFTVHAQVGLVQKNGDRFRNLIELGDYSTDFKYSQPMLEELKRSPNIREAAPALGSIYHAMLRQIIIHNPDGTESYQSGIQYMGDEHLLQTLQLDIKQGMDPHEAVEKYGTPLYINQKYADVLIPKGEDPVGQPASKYDEMFKDTDKEGETSIICGITENMYINSMEKDAFLTIFYLDNKKAEKAQFIYIRLDNDHKKQGLADIKAAWEKVNPGEYFTYEDVYAGFIQRNRKTTDMANLLLMYAIISIFLTCFGLFGMALYATEQRTKEIGIRKVNGASTGNIMLLLLRQFAGWIAIAFVIAVPVTWLLLNRWLEGFANRVNVAPIHFLLGGLTVLVITLLTVGWHSYRAASGNPVKSLRSE